MRRFNCAASACGRKPFLQGAVLDPDAEVVHRARECLKQIDEGPSAASTAAAIRVLAKLKPDGAAAALLNFLPSAGDESLAEAVRLALADLAVRDGKADARAGQAPDGRLGRSSAGPRRSPCAAAAPPTSCRPCGSSLQGPRRARPLPGGPGPGGGAGKRRPCRR